MVRKLVQHEGQLALLLDEQLLRDLNFSASTPLDVAVRGHELIVKAVEQPITDDELDQVLQTVNRDFGGALKRLAE